MSRASTTRAISSQSARPENIWVRVRAWSVNALMPASCIRSAMPTGSRCWSFQPLRVLAVTGRWVARDHRPDDPLDQVEVAEAAAAAVPLDHLLHRAAEVDVDELGPIVLGDETGGLGHGGRDRRRRSGSRSAAPPPRTPRPPAWCGSAGGWPPRRGTRTARRPPPSAGTPGDRAPRRRRPWVRG